MWIKYGANDVGSYATWVEPVPLDKPPPGVQTFTDRFIGVNNRTGENLRLSVVAEVDDGAGFHWTPATPTPGAPAMSFTVPIDATVYLVRPDTQKHLRARKLRIWADSTDGKRSWIALKNADVDVAPTPYTAEARQAFVVPFAKAGEPAALTAEQLIALGHSLYDQSKYLDARQTYDQLVTRYPSDPRAHEARFWEGVVDEDLGHHWDAVWDLYRMIGAAPAGHPLLGYAFFYQGAAYAELGYCGYAVRDFEVAADGELGLAPDWVQAARENIALLMNDDGQRCSSWQ